MCLIGSHAVESAAANGCQQQADVADGRDHSGASSNVETTVQHQFDGQRCCRFGRLRRASLFADRSQ